MWGDSMGVSEDIRTEQIKPKSYLKLLLGLPAFGLLWGSQAFSEFGSSFTRMSLFLLAFEYGKRASVGAVTDGVVTTATAVSLLMACQAIATLVLGPFGGPLVDRTDRRRLMVMADIARCAITACFMLRPGLWVLLALVFLHSTLTALFTPARSSILPDVVPKEDLMTAASLWQATTQGLAMLGPAVAGMTVAWAGLEAAFLFDAFTFLTSALALARLRLPQRPRAPRPLSLRAYLADLRSGLAYTWGQRTVRYYVSGLAFVALVGAVFNVSAITYYLETLGLSEQQFGWVSASNGVGAILAALLIGRAAWARQKDRLFVAGVASLGGVLTSYLARPGFWLLLPLTALVNGLSVSIVISAQTILYETVAPDFRGRVFSLAGAALGAAPLVGYAVAGALSGRVQPNILMAVCGIALLTALPVMVHRTFLTRAILHAHRVGCGERRRLGDHLSRGQGSDQ